MIRRLFIAVMIIFGLGYLAWAGRYLLTQTAQAEVEEKEDTKDPDANTFQEFIDRIRREREERNNEERTPTPSSTRTPRPSPSLSPSPSSSPTPSLSPSPTPERKKETVASVGMLNIFKGPGSGPPVKRAFNILNPGTESPYAAGPYFGKNWYVAIGVLAILGSLMFWYGRKRAGSINQPEKSLANHNEL